MKKVRLQAAFWDVSNANLSRIGGFRSQFLNYRGLKGDMRGFVCMEASVANCGDFVSAALGGGKFRLRDFWASSRFPSL